MGCPSEFTYQLLHICLLIFGAQVTGVPRNRIIAKNKRMGGGFGGKESRASQVDLAIHLAQSFVTYPLFLLRYLQLSPWRQRS